AHNQTGFTPFLELNRGTTLARTFIPKFLTARLLVRRAALGHMPGDNAPFYELDHAKQQRPHDRQQKNGHEDPRHIECALSRQDEIAQAMLGRDELADQNADQGKTDRNLHAGEQTWQSIRQTNLPKELEWRTAHGPAE